MGALVSLESSEYKGSKEVISDGRISRTSRAIISSKALAEFEEGIDFLEIKPLDNFTRALAEEVLPKTPEVLLGINEFPALINVQQHFQQISLLEERNSAVILPSPHSASHRPTNLAVAALRRNYRDGSSSSLSSVRSGLGGSVSIVEYLAKSEKIGSGGSQLSVRRRIKVSPDSFQKKRDLFENSIKEITLPEQNVLYPLPIERHSDNKETKKRKEIISKFRMGKFNSTSTLFIDSSIVNSDVTEYLK